MAFAMQKSGGENRCKSVATEKKKKEKERERERGEKNRGGGIEITVLRAATTSFRGSAAFPQKFNG